MRYTYQSFAARRAAADRAARRRENLYGFLCFAVGFVCALDLSYWYFTF